MKQSVDALMKEEYFKPNGEINYNNPKVKKLIKDAMVSVSSSEHHMFSIPLEVSINSGNNWGEAH